jgi:Viral BACON domain/Fibronectin type III domain
MRQAYRDPMSALPLRFLWGIALTFAIVIWTLPEALALTVSPTAMTFQTVQGGTNPPSRSVNVSKKNGRQATWTVSDSASWLTVSPIVGSITSTAQFAVAVNTTGLAAGTYSATVNITVSKGGSASIPVTLTVAPSTTTTSTSTSTTATLTWNPVTSTGLSGYKVYVGTASGIYGPPINVGNVTSYVMSNLAVGTYYFVVTGYNASGSESPPSNEVSKSIY